MRNLIRRITDSMLFRILLTFIVAASGTFFVIKSHWIWLGISIIILIGCIWWIVELYNTQLKKVILLLDALENNDNALRFSEHAGNESNRMINHLLNRVSQILYEAKSETLQQEKYYELILNCINTGVIVLNDKGAIYQKNSEALKLLGLDVFTHIQQLKKVDLALREKIEKALSGDKFHVQFNNERGSINLSVRVSDITIRNEHLRIFALNDINSELDEKELDSWIRLTRVLTHEIMNSITPITSLSDTMLSMAENKDEEIYRILQTINTTGKGLLSFVESYRKFTRIPTPEPELFYVKPFIHRMIDLARHQHPCENISFNVRIIPDELILYADENLISQVVINLLKNSIQAIDNQVDGEVDIHCYCNDADEVLIEISNNGPAISPEVAEQIFIPFFTTKEGGSGIGLSLSRQIMRLSGGSITLKPLHQSTFTTFVLLFK